MVNLLDTPGDGNGPIPNVPEDIFYDIGCRLVLLQELELFISFAVKVAFEENSEKAKVEILKANKQTMGQLTHSLRHKVTITDDFDEMLKRVLEARNLFVHNFSHKFNIREPEGLSTAIKFLIDSMNDLEEVTKVMKAVLVVYAQEHGITDPNIEENWRKYGDLNELESTHVPKVKNTLIKPG